MIGTLHDREITKATRGIGTVLKYKTNNQGIRKVIPNNIKLSRLPKPIIESYKDYLKRTEPK